jgi:hypothetical protein
MMMTVKQILSTMVVCVTVACSQAQGQDAALFPSLRDYNDEEIRLHGLAALFPDRVLFEQPQLETRSESRVATRVEDLPRGIKYIRLYRLDEAKSVLAEFQTQSALILDLRFLKSNDTAVDILGSFATAKQAKTLTTVGAVPADLSTSGETSTTVRDSPVVVLCNRETAGPFEAVLHQLQAAGAIIAVGQSTAGRTGFYSKASANAWILSGEIRPDSHTSLVGVGFQPRIRLESDAKENYLSYHLYEAGTDILQLLRNENSSSTDSDQASEADSDIIEPDRILQRGVDIIAALQILQQQPEL